MNPPKEGTNSDQDKGLNLGSRYTCIIYHRIFRGRQESKVGVTARHCGSDWPLNGPTLVSSPGVVTGDGFFVAVK